MSFLSELKYLYFKSFRQLLWQNSNRPIESQQKVFKRLISEGRKTAFGKEHNFDKIDCYESFCKHVPLINYEDMLHYTERIFHTEKNVLWPGTPAYFGRTSGTSTGEAKYIPVTNEFIKSTQFAAKYMMANLALKFGHTNIFGNKVFYVSDPHVFETRNGFLCAAISAIKSLSMPAWVKHFSLPGTKINSIDEPRERLTHIAVSIIKSSGIKMAVALPVWFVKFLSVFEKQHGKKFKEYFPDFKILFLSGMNYEPYDKILREHLGNDLLILENYTATEGNFAFQDRVNEKGMQIICNQGIFYEFISLDEANKIDQQRISLKDVEINRRYIMVISNNSGLWAYRMNDIIEFVSVDPYRLIVCGRTNDIFSPFGEHMFSIEIDRAIGMACECTGNVVKDFIVTPMHSNISSGHKWYIEFDSEFKQPEKFSEVLNNTICKSNVNYKDLIVSQAICNPVIVPVRKLFFEELLQKNEKYSVQTKRKHFETDQQRIEELEKLNNR